jgi:WD40 repeat protein
MRTDKKFVHLFILLITLFFLSSCQTATITQTEVIPVLKPTTSPTAVPTLEPTPPILYPQVISNGNAGLIKLVREFQVNQPMQVVWLKNSQSIWVINDANAVRINTQTGQTENVFTAVNPGQILSASSDGNTIIYLDNTNQNEIRVFNQSSNKTLMINPETVFEGADFSPDGTKISVPSLEQLQVTIWDTLSGAKLMTLKGFETAAPVYDAHIGADNQTLIWHSRGTIQLQNMVNQQMGQRFSHEDFVMGFSLSSDGQLMASTAGGTINGNYSPVVYVWDAHSGSNLANITYPDSLSALTFSPDRKLLAGASTGNLIFWDLSTNKVISVIQSQSSSIADLSFSPDGKSLLSFSYGDNKIKLWQVLQ